MEWILRYWTEVIFGVLAAFIGVKYKQSTAEKEKARLEYESLKMGMQALLRDRIIQAYNHYCDQGFFPIYARDNVEELFKQYENLGGNGMVHDLVRRMSKLPTEKN